MVFVNEIMSQHGALMSIVSDRNAYFTSKFWQKLQVTLGTNLHFNTTFHHQIDGQSE